MKKSLALMAGLVMSLSAQAAFVTLPDGVTPSTDLEVEIKGTAVDYGFDVTKNILAQVQFQLTALDAATDDLNNDGSLTVQFGYFDNAYNLLGWDLSGYSVLWADIEAAQVSAPATYELVFSSDFKSVVSGPYETASSLANGDTDYLVVAYVEGTFAVGNSYFAIDLEEPPVVTPPTPVPAPASSMLLILGLAGLAFRRYTKA